MSKSLQPKLTRRDFTVLSTLAITPVLLGGSYGCAGLGPNNNISANDISGVTIPLFERYPLLKEKLALASLGEFPTPVEKLDRLGKETGLDNLYIKRDDLSGRVYGGNKVRKLEFLLGKALRDNVKEVLTFGGAGSNHALATAIYAHRMGIGSISMLMSQPNAHYVRDNLLMSHYYNAELHHNRNLPSTGMATMYQFSAHKLKYGTAPRIIPPGGSSPLGTVGFVNAAFELKQQIVEGQIPEPDRIYVALGSMGTAVGLALGLRAADLKTRVISVRVVPEKFANARRFKNAFYETNSLLRSMDPSFPDCELPVNDIEINHDFFGREYALFTREGMEAVKLARDAEGIKLEGTYTGKTLAALINDARKKNLSDKTILFWNTYNSRDFFSVIDNIDYNRLPEGFHRYFEQDVQPLDRRS